MDIISKLDKNTILICDSQIKNKILNELYKNHKILDFKIMNLNEFIKKLTFDYDTKTIYYLMKTYNLTYDNALVYINNIYYIDDIKYNDDKLLKLSNIKQELIKNNLLIFDDIFKEYIKAKKIIFYDINTDYKFLNKLLKNLNYEILEKENNNIVQKEIYSFEKINDEINFVANKICELISNGVNTKSIKLAGVSSEYEFLLENTFKLYNLKINQNNNNLFSTEIGKYFIDNIEENDIIQKLKDNFDNSDDTLENINKIVDICNKYTWCSNFIEIKDLLIYELKNTKVYSKKYENGIEIINIEDVDSVSEDYIFLLGFNQENIPKICKDDKYITDKMKEVLDLEKSSDTNKRVRAKLIKNILELKNLTITFKNKTNFNTYYISNLNDDLKFNVIKISPDLTNSFSKINLEINLCQKLDNLIKYGVKDYELDILYSNFKEIPYKKYNNNYKQISKDELIDYLNNKLLLSYTSVDNYYHCKFKFYINNILKLDPFEQNFSAYIGSLMHYILSVCFNNNFNYDVEFNNFIKENDIELSPKDKFFLEKIKKELKFIIETINKQKYLTNFNHELYEQKIYIEKNNKIKVTFMGIIDKIMYMEKDGKNYLSIVDYKTGNINTDLKNIEHGFNLQLPIYAYLLKKSKLFSDFELSGLYYQKLLMPEVKATTKEEYEKEKYNHLKLIGLSTNDEKILENFDSSYQNSDLIKGMKTTSSGFSAYSKVYSKSDFDDILNITEKKIDEAINGILDADFKINPKQIGFENIGCKYCKYKDLCYMNESNKEVIEVGD